MITVVAIPPHAQEQPKESSSSEIYRRFASLTYTHKITRFISHDSLVRKQ